MPEFTFKIDKTDRMMIYHHGKPIKVLKPHAAIKLEQQLQSTDSDEQQRLMAAATGNYKRGNERT